MVRMPQKGYLLRTYLSKKDREDYYRSQRIGRTYGHEGKRERALRRKLVHKAIDKWIKTKKRKKR